MKKLYVLCIEDKLNKNFYYQNQKADSYREAIENIMVSNNIPETDIISIEFIKVINE